MYRFGLSLEHIEGDSVSGQVEDNPWAEQAEQAEHIEGQHLDGAQAGESSGHAGSEVKDVDDLVDNVKALRLEDVPDSWQDEADESNGDSEHHSPEEDMPEHGDQLQALAKRTPETAFEGDSDASPEEQLLSGGSIHGCSEGADTWDLYD